MKNRLTESWADACQPPDTREIYDWAAAEGELPAAYAVSGRFDISTIPFLRAPFHALRDPIVRNVISMAGVQCLKTLIGELWLLWLVANDPGPTQWLQPDDEEAREHAEERFVPLIEKFPAVHKFYTENRHHKKTTFIRFVHMFMRLEGANNPGNLQRKSIKNQMRSEVWQAAKWIPGRLKEADSRLTQFVHNSKTYTESQPGWDDTYGVDDMHGAYLAGDQNLLHFRCLNCDQPQPYHWDFKRENGTRAGLRWDDNPRTRKPSGEWLWGELAKTVRFECLHCGHAHADEPLTRRRMALASLFIPQNPGSDPATKSYTWGQLAMPNLSWFETKIGGVKNFLLAHQQAKLGFDKPLQDFWMKVATEPYNPAKHAAVGECETVELTTEHTSAKENIVFQGITFIHRFMAVDVQADHFWVLVEIWSAAGDSLTLHFEKVYTWDEIARVQEEWHVNDQNVLVDVSHRGEEVKDNCIMHGHARRGGWSCWKALRGDDAESYSWRPKIGPLKGKAILLPYTHPPEFVAPYATLPISDPRRAKLRGRKCPLITWSNPTIKDIVINRRDGKSKGCQNLIARAPWNTEFNRQMHSQRKAHVDGKWGSGQWKWVKKWDDHGLDCKCMITVRAHQGGLLGGETAPAEPPPAMAA